MRERTTWFRVFQSPHEDSFSSDWQRRVYLRYAQRRSEFQSPHEDSFSSDIIVSTIYALVKIAFQSPHEDSFSSDAGEQDLRRRRLVVFQSPHEDSFSSDLQRKSPAPRVPRHTRFQSPHEDSFSSDKKHVPAGICRYVTGFNPLTRIRSLLT